MWDYLFTYRTNLPEGVGWEHFGVAHLCYLALFAIATIVMVRIYRAADETLRQKIKIGYAVIVFTLEVVKDAICVITGVWESGLFPLHLCGMTIIFIIIHTIKANKWTATLLYSLSLPGAFMALVFGDWTVYPLLNFYCQQSFFIHFFELSFPILLIASGKIRPRFRDLWRSVIYLAIVVPPIYLFNLKFGTNFFFLNLAAPGSPLAPLEALGMPGYIFGYAGIVLVVWILMYLPWIIKSVIERQRSKTKVTSV